MEKSVLPGVQQKRTPEKAHIFPAVKRMKEKRKRDYPPSCGLTHSSISLDLTVTLPPAESLL